jgi:hypothetical protein
VDCPESTQPETRKKGCLREWVRQKLASVLEGKNGLAQEIEKAMAARFPFDQGDDDAKRHKMDYQAKARSLVANLKQNLALTADLVAGKRTTEDLVRMSPADMALPSVADQEVILIGISGATRSGKSTLARRLSELRIFDDEVCTIIHQDEFFRPGDHDNWETPEVVDHHRFGRAITRAVARAHARGSHLVIVEGFLAFNDPTLTESFDLLVWLDIDESQCRARRETTAPVPAGYHQRYIWPEHQRYRVRVLPRLQAMDDQTRFLRVPSEQGSDGALSLALQQIRAIWPGAQRRGGGTRTQDGLTDVPNR